MSDYDAEQDGADYYLGKGERRMAGTEGWRHILTADGSAGYELDELAVFYSPTARRYFWAEASGHSGDSFTSEVTGLGDFQDGDYHAAVRAMRAWTTTYGERSRWRAEAVAEVQDTLRAHWRRHRLGLSA